MKPLPWLAGAIKHSMQLIFKEMRRLEKPCQINQKHLSLLTLELTFSTKHFGYNQLFDNETITLYIWIHICTFTFISYLFSTILTRNSWRILRWWQGGITCGAIDEPRKSSKAIDKRVIIDFRDKNVVIARFRDKNEVFI